jgi:His/Glu/Gln/Arg/opine family amino acid ABC transporter permease subunit
MIDTNLIIASLPQLVQGAGVTLAIALCASLVGFIGGTLLGIVQTSGYRSLSIAVAIYATIIRGTPMLLQIVFLSLMLPSFGIHVSAFTTAVLAIGINSTAYISQVIRTGILSVSKGQIEAARTLGISSGDITRYIVLPQALRVVIPALGNEFITLIKDSSLASAIGVMELYMRGNIIMSQTYNSLAVYIATGLFYLCMTVVLSFIIHRVERRLNRHVRT